MTDVFLKKGRDFSTRHLHPWVFSGAIERVEGAPSSGETVRVVAHDGTPLARGAWSGDSQIRVRLFSFDPEREIDDAVLRDRLASSIEGRSVLLASDVTDACRLVNAEADGLPGLIVDRYADWIVCQFTTAGAERWKGEIVAALDDLLHPKGIYERSDADVRRYEGLEASNGLRSGEEPPERIEIRERGVRFLVDVREGHKTGFYLDQRDNRAIVSSFAKDREVLNVFSYTGGFGLAAVAGGAKSATHVDLSAPALAIAKANADLNGFAPERDEFIEGNAFEVLRSFRDSRRSFDLIVLDPPKFADAKRHLMGACRGYKDINLLAMKLLRPGGYLATFSCSGLMTPDLFHKVVSEAAVDSKRDFQVVRHLQQATDHPEGLCFPEGLYLKGLLCRVR